MPSLSAKRSRRPTLNPIPNMGKTFSTVMLPTRISGFRIRSIAIRIPGSCLTASLLTPSWRKSRNRRGSVIQKISATRLLTSYCAPERITADAIRTGPAMKNCARLSRRKCSPIPRSCCRLSRLTPKNVNRRAEETRRLCRPYDGKKGYTRKQVRLLCEWYLRVRKSS